MSCPLNVTNLVGIPNCRAISNEPSKFQEHSLFNEDNPLFTLPPEIFLLIGQGATEYESLVNTVKLSRVCKAAHLWIHPDFIAARFCLPSSGHMDSFIHCRPKKFLSPILEELNDCAENLNVYLFQKSCGNGLDLGAELIEMDIQSFVCGENKQLLYPAFVQMLNNHPNTQITEVLALSRLCSKSFLDDESDQKAFDNTVRTYIGNHWEDYKF